MASTETSASSRRSQAQRGKIHKAGGQGRVRNPETDGRLRANRGKRSRAS